MRLRVMTDIREQYQQIFCLSQALPGSASVKMLLCINAIRNGLVAGFLAFLLFWYLDLPSNL